MTSLSNQQVANIYDNILTGDKNALFKLQNIRVKNHPPRFIQSYYKKKVKEYTSLQQPTPITFSQNKEPNLDQQPNQLQTNKEIAGYPEGQVESPPEIEHKDSHYMVAIKRQIRMSLKQDGASTTNNKVKIHRNRKMVESTSGYYAKQKTILDKIQAKLEQQLNKPRSIDAIVQPKTQQLAGKYQLPKVNKSREEPEPNTSAIPKPSHKQKDKSAMVKAQSANIQPAKKISQLQKSDIKAPKKPRQKVDFKQIISKSKIQKQLLAKVNQQQRQLQQQLMKLHINNKQHLHIIHQKYGLNDNRVAKFMLGKKNRKKSNNGQTSLHLQPSKKKLNSKQPEIKDNVSKESQQQQLVGSVSKMSPFKRNMSNQKIKCSELYDQINGLSSAYNRNYMNLKKLEKARSQLLFQRYLQRYGLEIQEQLQEEIDVVKPLHDEGDKYTQNMALTRERKWGLQQRHQYESQRTQTLSQSRQTNKSKFTQFQTRTNQSISQQNKITFNQNLKKLLFN